MYTGSWLKESFIWSLHENANNGEPRTLEKSWEAAFALYVDVIMISSALAYD